MVQAAAGAAGPSAASRRTGILAGVRALDLGTGAVAPDVTRHMADLGAEVIRVEFKVSGDTPSSTGGARSVSLSPPSSNRNKRSIALELRSPQGNALLKRLVALCDVVVENNRVGMLESMGLDYASLKAVKSDIIMMRLPSVGVEGPRRRYRSLGPNLPALSGVAYLWSYDSQEPVAAHLAHPDYYAGKVGLCLVMAALLRRKFTGEGQHLEAPQSELVGLGMAPTYLDVLINGSDPQPAPNELAQGAPYGCFPCSGEDTWCAISVTDEEQWQALGCVIGEAWVREQRFATLLERKRNSAALSELMTQWTRGQNDHALMDRLQAVGVPASIVMTRADLADDPHLKEREAVVPIDDPTYGSVRCFGLGFKLSRVQPDPFVGPPWPGQDTQAICAELLRMKPDEIEELRRTGVMS